MSRLHAAADAILHRGVSMGATLPGVVAIAVDRTASLYEGAAGKRAVGRDAAMTTDSVFALFSATKAVTATAVLQLVEQGRLDLDAPARRHAPELGTLRVLDGFEADGEPRLRPPRREITTRMLLLHSAGFGYAFFNAQYERLARRQGWPEVISGSKASLLTPLLFDPGEAWEYGSGTDWAGLVVEGITGRRLGCVMQEHIFTPLGMHSTGFRLTASMRRRLARVHQRQADGSLTVLRLELPQQPEIEMGGHGLYSTAGDYSRFIRMWLNDGAFEGGRVLRPETVRMAARHGLGAMRIKPLPGVNAQLSNDVELFPGLPKSWSLASMVNAQRAPTGRPAGALGWAGLANLFYWIDRAGGVGGVWATQILPFGDAASMAGWMAFETAVYDSLG